MPGVQIKEQIALFENAKFDPAPLYAKLDDRELNDRMRDLDTPLPSILSRAPEVPRELAAIVDRLLVKRKAHRTPSATVVLAELRAFLAPKEVRGEDQTRGHVFRRHGGLHWTPAHRRHTAIFRTLAAAAEMLTDLGFTPVVVDIGEFEKLEGCVTCLSVLLPGS